MGVIGRYMRASVDQVDKSNILMRANINDGLSQKRDFIELVKIVSEGSPEPKVAGSNPARRTTSFRASGTKHCYAGALTILLIAAPEISTMAVPPSIGSTTPVIYEESSLAR